MSRRTGPAETVQAVERDRRRTVPNRRRGGRLQRKLVRVHRVVEQSGMDGADIIVVGAGAAGLSLAGALVAGPWNTLPAVALLEPPDGPARGPERTWCFWEPEAGPYDLAVTATWDRLRVRGPDGHTICGTPHGLRYKMIRSPDFETLMGCVLAAAPRFRRIRATVTDIADGPDGALVTAVDGRGKEVRLRGRWVYDSRPPHRLPPARTTLLQHFRGWFLRTERDAFDPGTAELMDFRTPQPRQGLSFGYVLPLNRREALVEYTEFSSRLLEEPAYEAALRHYTGQVLRLGPLTVLRTEQGVIPMTDGVFPRRVGRSVFRIGTAGGATRPATGYTFSAIQRQSTGIADAYRAGRTPLPPAPHSKRHRAMDAVVLRALASGRVNGAEFFAGLFRRNSLTCLLRFLDGQTSPAEEFGIGLSTPVLQMLRCAVELPLLPRGDGAVPG